jgi:hypothetical protein
MPPQQNRHYILILTRHLSREQCSSHDDSDNGEGGADADAEMPTKPDQAKQRAMVAKDDDDGAA